MTPDQAEAFYEAAGFYATSLSFAIRLLVGGLTLGAALLILAGLLHLLSSGLVWDQFVFMLSLLMLSFIVMLVFITIA